MQGLELGVGFSTHELTKQKWPVSWALQGSQADLTKGHALQLYQR